MAVSLNSEHRGGRWETKVGNCEVTSQALCPVVKLLIKMDGSKVPTAVHGPLGNTRGLSKKYPTLFFPGKTSDSRLANVITVVGRGVS
jgi:hypothetical protein